MKFRELRADEIEVRVSHIAKNNESVMLLLYKDARCDMNILDDIAGADKWQREHYECKGNLFCRVGIKSDEWVWKSDCGTESNTERQKGEASDSFKRACFNWGIGRELYTAPTIWVKGNIQNGKCYDEFIVSEITYKNGKIDKLVIKNKKTGAIVFPANNYTKAPEKKTEAQVRCPKCDRIIVGANNKAGQFVTPAEILKKLGSCAVCYKKNES